MAIAKGTIHVLTEKGSSNTPNKYSNLYPKTSADQVIDLDTTIENKVTSMISYDTAKTSGDVIGTLNINGTDHVLYSTPDTTYPSATASTSGLMSATDKAKLDNLTDYNLPTASTSIKGGIKIGNGLSMDGDTLNVTIENSSSGGGGNSIDYVIGANVSTVEGGFWQDTINDAPVLKLRHGDYEYNFQYDNLTRVSNNDTTAATVTPDTYVLSTASSTVDGSVWYEVNSQDVPTLKLHKGNYNYGFNYDLITYKGDNSHLTAYLPFNVSTTADACGNTWTATGRPQIVGGALSLDGSSCLTNSTISNSISEQPWTIEFWASASNSGYFFGTQGYPNVSWVAVTWNNGTPGLIFYNDDHYITETLQQNHLYHYAVSYDGTIIRLFIDGIKKIELNRKITLNGDFYIGRAPDGRHLVGTISNFRIFKGIALWTSNFTPPTANDYA